MPQVQPLSRRSRIASIGEGRRRLTVVNAHVNRLELSRVKRPASVQGARVAGGGGALLRVKEVGRHAD
eukprot:5586884-Prymnesium_polylepis.1